MHCTIICYRSILEMANIGKDSVLRYIYENYISENMKLQQIHPQYNSNNSWKKKNKSIYNAASELAKIKYR